MMFFTQKGKCYWLKVYEIPEGTKNSKGRAIQNLFITIRHSNFNYTVILTNCNSIYTILTRAWILFKQANRNGRAIRFHEAAVRVMGRTATGVRGITLDNDGQLIRRTPWVARPIIRTSATFRRIVIPDLLIIIKSQDVDNADTATDVNENNNEIEE